MITLSNNSTFPLGVTNNAQVEIFISINNFCYKIFCTTESSELETLRDTTQEDFL